MTEQPQPPTGEKFFSGTNKRERILRAAVDVFAAHGYFTAKVTQIAKAAGVADGTIYLYFEGKEDLLITLFREHTRAYLQALELKLEGVEKAPDRLRIAVHHHLETLGSDRAMAVVAQVELRHSLKFMSLLSQQEVADYLGIIRKIVEEGQRSGELRRTVHPVLVAKAVFGVLDEMVTSWILSEKNYDLGAQSDDVAGLILTGLV